MGKNKQAKDEAPSPNSVVNRETFQRLNFLYQASTYLKGIESSSPGTADEPVSTTGKKKRKATLGELGSSYVRCMRTIGNKSVIRIDPNIKRTLCKRCDTVLFPGTTASVRVKRSPGKGHRVVYTCLACHASRTILAPPVPPSPTQNTSAVSPNSVAPTTSLQTTPDNLELPGGGPSSGAQAPQARDKKRKKPTPRPLPLFARPDAGHVVFRGNERLSDSLAMNFAHSSEPF